MVKNLPDNARDTSPILGWGRSPGEEYCNPLQYSCLENSVDKGAWQATVHEVTKSWTRLSDFLFFFFFLSDFHFTSLHEFIICQIIGLSSVFLISYNPSINPERQHCQLYPLLGEAKQFVQAHGAVVSEKARIQIQIQLT